MPILRIVSGPDPRDDYAREMELDDPDSVDVSRGSMS